MDKSRFDDIIREKLESHVDPAGPSGAEMSRLFAEIPKAGTSAITSITKMLITISSLLVIITIFLIYRNYRLEEVVRSMQMEIVELGKGGADVTYFPDTVFWDSLQSITSRIVIQNQKAQRSEASSTITLPGTSGVSAPSLDQVKLSAVDSQAFVNQVIEQLIATMENNPQLLEELLKNVPFENFSLQDSMISSEPESGQKVVSVDEVRKSIMEELKEHQAVEKVLVQIASDSTGRAALIDLVSGNEPGADTNDQLNLSPSSGGDSFYPQSLSEAKQEQVLEEYLAYDPGRVAQASRELELGDAAVTRIEEYAEMEDLQKKDVVFDSLVLARPALLSNEEIREEQEKQKNREWHIGGGVGYGSVELKGFESGAAISLQSEIERKLNERFSLSTGVEFYSAEVENYNIEDIDFSLFEDLPSGVETTAAEVKVNLTWLDIPLEAKVYLLPGKKVNPYVTVAVRARTLVGEKYKIETSADDLLPTYQPGSKFSFPTYGFGIGADVELNPRVRTGLQINQLLGGNELGLFENEYRIFNGQAYLLFRLKK